MQIFVGLGNPGSKYAGHRHNIGFMAADALADYWSFGPEKSRFQGLARDGVIDTPEGREKILLLKPQTYMNESGRSVGEAMRFFKLGPEDVTVFYDELDLAPGKVRVKNGGGAAGHNGIRSTMAHIGAAFWRVRLGIGHPGHKDRVTGHVLGDFAKAERDGWLPPLLDALARAAPLLAAGDMPGYMTEVARLAPAPGGEKKPAKTKAKQTDKSDPQTDGSQTEG